MTTPTQKITHTLRVYTCTDKLDSTPHPTKISLGRGGRREGERLPELAQSPIDYNQLGSSITG